MENKRRIRFSEFSPNLFILLKKAFIMTFRDIIKYLLIIIIFIAIGFFSLIGIYGDLLWFGSLGYSSVLITILTSRIALGLLAALLVFFIVSINWKLAKKVLSSEMEFSGGKSKIAVLIIGFISVMAGIAFSSQWNVLLKFLNATSFGVTDPVFGKDLGFFVFSLPFYKALLGLLIGSLVLSLIITLITYLIYARPIEDIREIGNVMYNIADLKERAKAHLSFISGVLFLMIGFWTWLSRYDILFSTRGAVFGAAYTDVHIILPLITLMSFISVIVGVLFLLEKVIKNLKYPLIGVGVLIVILIGGNLVAGAVQQFQVEPDEYNTEKPYIKRNIDYTLKGFNLDELKEVPFKASYNMSFNELQKHNDTINNIRLWDYRALKDTYSQLQLIRSYYDFSDVDVDRYNIKENGKEKYSQVMLSPRELNQNDLSSKAKTWVNEHLVYTHGYGMAMSPVNKISQGGLPELWIKDIPPKADKGLKIERAEIYYGEKTNNYVVVNSQTEEFDYPKGGENVYTNYNGPGGVELSGLSKFAFAVKFGSLKMLISGSVDSESKIMLNRNIKERVRELAPFLEYDSDPYMVNSEGKLYWIVDAYTTTDKYPYSEQYGPQKTNYARNSVKVVVNAYTGETNFYVIEEEPLIETYKKIYPDLFEDFSKMPDNLKKHIRYPEDLFKLQTQVYSTYHMEDPRVFYNKEDQWKIPKEVYSGNNIKMEPYYVLMDLPGEDKNQEFIMMTPFTPKGKDNMIGWMGAKSDPADYGEKIVYQFSKQELIYGPSQIEARIDQDTDISQRITLWSQSGSRVIRGNLLVIPIEDSLLYIEPVYLKASGGGSIPQLKRVIVAYGDKLAMRESLGKALQAVFKEEVNKTKPEGPGEEEPVQGDLNELLDQASQKYNEAQELLKQGDFSGYAEKIEKVGEILDQIEKLRTNQTIS